MAVPLIVAAIGFAVAAAAAGIGRAVASGKEAEAKKIYDEAVAEYGDDIIPQLHKELAGKLPESSFKNITGQEGSVAVRDTYEKFKDVYDQEGTTDADKAALELARQQVEGQTSGQFAGLQQALNARGQANNPALMAAMYSQLGQQSTNQLGNMANQNQVAARQRALQALGQAGGLGQSMMQRDLQSADAMDRINMYNFDKNLELKQQDFLNTLRVRDARTAAKNKIAEYYMQQAKNDMQTAGQVGQAATSMAGAGAGYASDMDLAKLKGGK